MFQQEQGLELNPSQRAGRRKNKIGQKEIEERRQDCRHGRPGDSIPHDQKPVQRTRDRYGGNRDPQQRPLLVNDREIGRPRHPRKLKKQTRAQNREHDAAAGKVRSVHQRDDKWGNRRQYQKHRPAYEAQQTAYLMIPAKELHIIDAI